MFCYLQISILADKIDLITLTFLLEDLFIQLKYTLALLHSDTENLNLSWQMHMCTVNGHVQTYPFYYNNLTLDT